MKTLTVIVPERGVIGSIAIQLADGSWYNPEWTESDSDKPSLLETISRLNNADQYAIYKALYTWGHRMR